MKRKDQDMSDQESDILIRSTKKQKEEMATIKNSKPSFSSPASTIATKLSTWPSSVGSNDRDSNLYLTPSIIPKPYKSPDPFRHELLDPKHTSLVNLSHAVQVSHTTMEELTNTLLNQIYPTPLPISIEERLTGSLIRGARNADFKRNLQALIDLNNPTILALTETKMEDHDNLLQTLEYIVVIQVPDLGYSGGIALFWKSSKITIKFFILTDQEIHSTIEVSSKTSKFFFQ
ncbi:hypothetical protein RDI58_027007 [Solanum bulbocastanum]|uniref:Endonuclease/exonuclease/phosphatase domain-containing protein n=1 Tax=Solanum bulbocastanum TaxID=147425 RepID=A0AAN8Y1R4_SOLBU